MTRWEELAVFDIAHAHTHQHVTSVDVDWTRVTHSFQTRLGVFARHSCLGEFEDPHTMYRRIRLLAFLAVALALPPATAQASLSVSYDLTVPNADISSYPSPYGTVTVSIGAANSSTATVTFVAN